MPVILGRWRIFGVVVGGVAVLALPVARAAMADLFLFSAVSGTVLVRGTPVAGAEITRTYHWAWNDVTATDKTRTDARGHFAFPRITAASLLGSLLPHEPLVTQEILIRNHGSEYKAWAYTKHNYQENGELGRPINLMCHLENPPAFHGEVFGICTVE